MAKLKCWKKGKELGWTTFTNKNDPSYKIRIEGDSKDGYIVNLRNREFNYKLESLGMPKKKTQAIKFATKYMKENDKC